MKAGDKVFIAVEVEEIEKSSGMFTGVSSDLRTYWYKENQAITQLPIQEGRWMMVSHSGDGYVSRFVIGKFKGDFIAIQNASNEVDLKKSTDLTTSWKYAKEIPNKRKLTMKEIAEKFNEDVENIEICTE